MGARGWGRVQYFRNHFDVGWGEQGRGRVLSPRAFEAFLRFIEVAQFPVKGKKPSVFLTDAGGIELCGEDKEGHAVQLEFRSKGADYFLAWTNVEEFIDYSRLPELTQTVSG